MPRLVVHLLQLEGELDDVEARALSRALPYARVASAARSAADRTRSLAGIVLARQALGELLGRPVSAAELWLPLRGKPHLREHADVSFSIAHSGPWVIAAAAMGDVGIDLEWLPLAPRLAMPLERWVRREAEAKCLGLGLVDFMRQPREALPGTSVDVPECVAWLASRAPVAQVDVRRCAMRVLRALAAA